jgi:putrescine transport system substrate-binding protein
MFLKKTILFSILFPVSLSSYAAEKVVNIYNWADYVPADVIASFEKETGIKVNYDVFDSSEMLEAKLFAGNSGYDVVVPTDSPFLKRQIEAGIYQPLDHKLLSNYNNLDLEALAELPRVDKDNKYSIPYLWGTLGIGYNVDKVKAALGSDVKIDSWEFILNPDYMKKLHSCGVSVLSSGAFILPATLRYLGKDPSSTVPADYDEVKKVWEAVRPYVSYFSNNQHINDLADGEICVAVTYSGDVFMAGERAREAKNGQNIVFSIPKEGTAAGFDSFAIPKDAKNVKEAHLFIDYMLRAKVAAQASNELGYATANKAAYPLLDKATRDNPNIYPSKEMMKKLFAVEALPPDTERLRTRLWTTITTGR